MQVKIGNPNWPCYCLLQHSNNRKMGQSRSELATAEFPIREVKVPNRGLHHRSEQGAASDSAALPRNPIIFRSPTLLVLPSYLLIQNPQALAAKGPQRAECSEKGNLDRNEDGLEALILPMSSPKLPSLGL